MVDDLRIPLNNKENIYNKVTSLNENSNDNQYPSAKCVFDTIETKINKLQKSVTTFKPIDYVIEEDGVEWDNDNTMLLPTNGNTITFNFTNILNDTGDYFEWELGVLHGTAYMVDDEHSDEIWNSSVNSMIRIRITKNEYSDSYHITTTDLSNNTIIKDYDKDYHFNLTFLSLNGVIVSFNNMKWYHTVSFIDMIYPIGSIYMSVNSVNPSLFIGGIWEQIEDCFLLASGQIYQNGTTGGSADATLVSHNHTTRETGEYFVTSENSDSNNTKVSYSASGNRYVDGMTSDSTPFHHRTATGYEGSSATGKNMPPYLTVYMWKRVS